MTHFNHDWDATQNPAVPVAIGDRYYAQDLNDDFNYLKHLPYEVFLQGRSRGVMVSPQDTWDNDNNQLTLSGGFGVILQDHICLDSDEDWSIPPKTKVSPRYERIPFTNTTLTLPNDDNTHYIIVTPTKRSLLQRTKALLTSQYASRTKYDGVITIQNTAPTAGQILIGLCHDKEYCLLIDNNPDQCKNNIILKKWFGQNKITHSFVSVLQSYYNTGVEAIETVINIDDTSDQAIRDGVFNNCIIGVNGVSGYVTVSSVFNNCTISIDNINTNTIAIREGAFNNCAINIGSVTVGIAIYDGFFNNCTINMSSISGHGIEGGTFNNCIINVDSINDGVLVLSGNLNGCNITIKTLVGNGTRGGIFNNCNINIETINRSFEVSRGINGGTFNNCNVIIGTINNGNGVGIGIFNNCAISISEIASGHSGILNTTTIVLCLTNISSPNVSNINATGGKLNVVNNSILHAS